MNTFINSFIMVGGVIHFLAIIGGIGFLVFFCFWLFQHRPQRAGKERRRCENCQSYKICVDLMADCLPDYPCAYWEKKKP